jgi:uncharacterized protein involved in exopolysaccharide biosynthesis
MSGNHLQEQPQGQTPQYPQQAAYADDEIDLKELFMALWAEKIRIIAVTAVFAIGAVVFAIMQPNIYRSEALLAPVQAADGAGALASRFGGLASLAGVSLPGGGADKTALAIEYVKSRAFLATFMEKHPEVLVELMAVEGWSAGDNTLVFDAEVYDAETGEWVREVDFPKQPKPSLQEAHKVFKEAISVSQDKETSFVTMSVEHLSPYVAAKWVGYLVEGVNEALRQKDIDQAQRSIAFLENEIEKTSLAEMRSNLFSMIQAQTETIMLANTSPEYIFKTVDPAVVPEEKAKPKRALIAVLGTMLGGMLAVLWVLIRHFAGKQD